jgi:hypothetical protein
MKTIKYILIGILLLIFLYYVFGYINSYIGYYGYNKEKIRRYSITLNESKKRNTFIGSAKFNQVTSDINNVFIEKGYKWGNSDGKTIILSYSDTFRNNNPSLPYQLIVEYKESQNGNLVYIPQNRMLLKEDKLRDTLIFKIFIRDSANNLKKIDTLKIWQ